MVPNVVWIYYTEILSPKIKLKVNKLVIYFLTFLLLSMTFIKNTNMPLSAQFVFKLNS